MKLKRATTPKRKRGRKLTAAQARALFSYSKLTGIVRWRVRPYPQARVYPGDRAGTISESRKGSGHFTRQITYQGRIYKEHRLIWLIVTGKWPRPEVDHENGDACDNRWRNLRRATTKQNRTNVRMHKRNRSGFKWVRTMSDYARAKPYQAVVGGKMLGNFRTAAAAHAHAAAYAKARHGKFFTTRRAAAAVAKGARM